MTPAFCCGGECGILAGPHWGTSSITTFDTGTVNNGARSIKVAAVASSVSGPYSVFSSGGNYISIRFYIRFSTLPNKDCWVFSMIASTSGDYLGLGWKNSTGDLRLVHSTSVPVMTFGSDGFTPSTGAWYKVELRINTSANPHLIDGTIGSTTLTQLSKAQAGENLGTILCGFGGAVALTATAFFDDIIVVAGADYPIGAGYVNHFIPTSDGSHNVAGSNDFERGTTGTDIVNATTDSYLLVDDVPMDDTTPDADDSIGCIAPPNSTDYTENVFGPAPGVSTPTTGPRAVEVCYAHHEAGTGNGVSAAKLNDNGTTDDVYAPGSVPGVTTTRYARKHYATMVGGGAWTAARFNNLRMRFGYSSDANPDQFFDCAMIEAEWEEVPTTNVKTLQGVSYLAANIKTVQGLAFASVKSIQGLE